MPARINLSGQVFNRWTVLSYFPNNKTGAHWLCRCDCGTEKVVKSQSLVEGTSKSCGCYNMEVLKQSIDISGERFGRLLVKSIAYKKGGKTYFNCICDCGKHHITNSNTLKSGQSISCGCYKNDFHRENKTTHGMHKTRIYRCWRHMLDRCENPNNDDYNIYGGAGITVCEQWHKFENWYADVKDGYADDLTLDRYPNMKGNYEPGNVRWATGSQQCRNTRNTVFIEFNGERLPRIEWSERLGLKETLIQGRISRGWSIVDALTKPVNENIHKNRKNKTTASCQIL